MNDALASDNDVLESLVAEVADDFRERLGRGTRRQCAERRLGKASEGRHPDADDKGLPHWAPPSLLPEADIV